MSILDKIFEVVAVICLISMTIMVTLFIIIIILYFFGVDLDKDNIILKARRPVYVTNTAIRG